ncbi:hypothetical protein D3C77_530600 [compost metagenome]
MGGVDHRGKRLKLVIDLGNPFGTVVQLETEGNLAGSGTWAIEVDQLVILAHSHAHIRRFAGGGHEIDGSAKAELHDLLVAVLYEAQAARIDGIAGC